jgi:CelD/BcsL family acetyltransferase involved in cellulose biosynthesis
MRARVVTDLAGLAPHLDGWRALAEDAQEPFSSPDWMLPLWEHRDAERGPLRVVVVTGEDGAPVGIGPFFLARRPRRLVLLGDGEGQRTGLLAAAGREAEVAAAVAAALAAAEPGAAAVELPALAAGAPWPGALADAWPGRVRLQVLRREAGRTLTLAADHDAWLAARSRNFRKKDAKRRRLLAEAGVVARRSTGEAQVEADARRVLELHHRRSATAEWTTSVGAATADAVVVALRRFEARGAAHVLVLERDGEVVAGDLQVSAGGRLCCWNGGFEPALEDLSPGIAVLLATIEDAHGRGLRTIDLGAGDQAYKDRFADADSPLVWVRLVLPGPRLPVVAALAAAERLKAALRRRLRPDPAA